MQVIQQAFEDAGQQNADGLYDYYYAGIMYRFVFADREYYARRYQDTPGEAHFLAYATPGGARCSFAAIPYDEPEFGTAAAYLRDTVGADRLEILLPSGYVPVDFAQFPGELQASDDAGELLRCLQCRAAIPEAADKCPECGWTWQQ